MSANRPARSLRHSNSSINNDPSVDGMYSAWTFLARRQSPTPETGGSPQIIQKQALSLLLRRRLDETRSGWRYKQTEILVWLW